jgi:hypothetical protein
MRAQRLNSAPGEAGWLKYFIRSALYLQAGPLLIE